MLTGFIPTLSINYKNHRQIFVESLTDVSYYQSIYSSISSNEKLNHKLYFISNNNRGKTNCDWVKQIVGQLRASGNNTCSGIIDWDKKNVSNNDIIVHGEKFFYSVENVILDPVYLIAYFLKKNGAHNVYSELGFQDTYNQYNIGSEDNEKLQQIWDWVIDKLVKRFPHLGTDNEKITLSYYNGKVVNIPKWYLELQGHELGEKLKVVFPALSKYQNEGELQEHLSKIIAKCFPLIPQHTVNVLKKVSNE